MNIIDRIKKICSGTRIPKPESEDAYTVKGIGRSRGEDALVYFIPGTSGSEKRVPFSAFIWAEDLLATIGKLTRSDFARLFPKVDNDGDCNFTTLGGIFVLLGEAEYESHGVYCRKGN